MKLSELCYNFACTKPASQCSGHCQGVGDYKLAEENLLASVERSARKGVKQILSGSYLHLAKLYFDTGEKEEAADYLQKAFALASKHGYSMFWDIHLPTLTEMALRCLKNGIYAGYAREMLERYFRREAVVYFERNLNMITHESIPDFAKQILSRYGVTGNTDFSYTIDIRLLTSEAGQSNYLIILKSAWKMILV